MTSALTTFIAEKDKEPIWDGNIHVYSNSKKDLDHHKGRVPVQVKGKLVDNVNQDSFSYPIRTKDLQSYLAEGGTIYFVVLIDQIMGDTRIFYASLLPFEIIKMLGKAKNQATKNVHMKPFPKVNEDKVDIFFNFLNDRKKQQPLAATEKNYTLEDLIKQGSFKELSFGYTSSKKTDDPFEYLFNNGMYIYAVTNLGIMYPIEHVSQVEVTTTELKKEVSVNGKIYYNKYLWEHWKDREEIQFGKNVILKIDNANQKTVFKINFNGTLKEQITALEFYMAAVEAHHFTLDGSDIPLSSDDEKEIQNLDFPTKKKHLKMLKKVQSAFDAAGVTEDLNCDILSDKDENNIKMLTRAFIEHKEVSLNSDSDVLDVFCSGYLTIANIRMMITAYKQESGRYLLGNFFTNKLSIQRKDAKGNFYNVSQFYILRRKDYHDVSNINYDFIYKDIIRYQVSEEYENDIILMLLEMFSAYDEKPKEELLDLTIKLSKWMHERTPDNAVCYINYLQAVYRKSGLIEDEKKWLEKHMKNMDTPKEQKLGCAILLKKYELCEFMYLDFTKEEQENFSLYPIMNLWKKVEKLSVTGE